MAHSEFGMKVAVVIPALNEEQALPRVLRDLIKHLSAVPGVTAAYIIVSDNGSTDRTAEVARAEGAQVMTVPQRGYGAACLAAIAVLSPDTDLVVFVDGDNSIFAEDLPALLRPLLSGEADFVLGERQPIEDGALTFTQRWGNALACGLIKWIYGYRYRDLGPFRAIRRDALLSLEMRDKAFGWTVEMQIKALDKGLRIREVPVRYRVRIGQSKISGTLKGSFLAGKTILWTIARELFP